MTISTEIRKAGPFTGNDVTTEFAFTFKVFSAADLTVVRADLQGAESTLVLDTDFTATLNANQNTDPGGLITLSAPLTAGYALVITTTLGNLQPTDLTNNGGFFPQVITNALDRLTILVQQLTERVGRALRVSITTPDGINPELPTPAADSLIGWNSAGDGLVNFPTTTALLGTALSSSAGSTLVGEDDGASGTLWTTVRGFITYLRSSVGSSLVGFLQSGTGAVARTAQEKMREFVSLTDFGAVGDGVTDDSTAFNAAVTAALAGGRGLIIPHGTYKLNSAHSFTYTGELEIIGVGDCTLLLNPPSTVGVAFNATQVLQTTLSSDAAVGATSITISSATGVETGQLIYLYTTVPVDTAYLYKKQSVLIVGYVDGTTVHLSEPLNFPFTAAETTVYFYGRASVKMAGVRVLQATTTTGRFDLWFTQDDVLDNCTFEATTRQTNDILFIGAAHGSKVTRTNLINGRYTAMATNGARNLLFEDIFAKGNRHPIDMNTWTFNCTVRRMRSYDTQSSIQCHPCFTPNFEDCVDVVTGTGGGIGLRSIGGSAKRCKTYGTAGVVTTDAQSPLLDATHAYIGQLYDRVYEDIESATASLSAGFTNTLQVRRCNVPSVTVDGTSNAVSFVDVDEDTEVSDALYLRRIPVIAKNMPVTVTPFDSFGSRNVSTSITAIAQANPGVVTSAAHGLVDGDLVWIDGVVGMVEVNEGYYTVAGATADTFQLSGIDTTAYTAYSSGGKATKGDMHKTIDPDYVPGLGWYPHMHFRAVVRESSVTLSPGTSVTIPVKVRNVWGIQERIRRHILITVRVYSRTDGAVVNKYQANAFIGSTSSFTLSTAQAEVPAISTITAAISSARPHYYTQVSNEGGTVNYDEAKGFYYYAFDVVVTANATTDIVDYVEIECDEVRPDLI